MSTEVSIASTSGVTAIELVLLFRSNALPAIVVDPFNVVCFISDDDSADDDGSIRKGRTNIRSDLNNIAKPTTLNSIKMRNRRVVGEEEDDDDNFWLGFSSASAMRWFPAVDAVLLSAASVSSTPRTIIAIAFFFSFGIYGVDLDCAG